MTKALRSFKTSLATGSMKVHLVFIFHKKKPPFDSMMLATSRTIMFFGVKAKIVKALQYIFNLVHNAHLGKSLQSQVGLMVHAIYLNEETDILMF